MINKPIVTALWFVAFLSLFCVGISIGLPKIIPHINQHTIAKSKGAGALNREIRFEKKYQAYLQSPPNRRIVIVGACQLGDVTYQEPLINMSLAGARTAEAANIIKGYCHDSDSILYAFSLREFVVQNYNIRLTTQAPLFNKISIAKGLARAELVMFPRANEPRRAPVKHREIPHLSLHMPPEQWPNLSPLLVERYFSKAAACSVDDLDLAPLHKIWRRRGKTTFILLPTINLSPVDCDCSLAQQINHYIHLRQHLHSALAASGLPVIDLSDALPPTMFQDWHHLTDEGKTALRDKIIEIVPLLSPQKENQGTFPSTLISKSWIGDSNPPLPHYE
jgi:hypothetical protein